MPQLERKLSTLRTCALLRDDRARLERAVDEERAQDRHAHRRPRTTSSASWRAGRPSSPTCCATPSRPASRRRPPATRWRSRTAGRCRAGRSAAGSAARTRRRRSSRSAGPSTAAAPNGMIAATISAGAIARIGASVNRNLCALPGTKSSLKIIFSASATKWSDAPGLDRADVGAVRAEAVLHHRGLPALQPGQQRRQRHQEAEHQEQDLDRAPSTASKPTLP